MPDITARQIQRDFGEILTSVRRGETYDITHYGVKVARLMPYRENTVSQEPPFKTYADIDEDRRAAFVQETLDRLRQLVGNDRLEALRVLNEMEAALLANRGRTA